MAVFSDLYGTLLDRELGSADRTDLFTTARRKAAINEAQKEFNRLTECYTRRRTITLVDATGEYNLESNFTDFLWIAKDGVEVLDATSSTNTWYSGNDNLPRREITWLNTYEPQWRDASAGTPMCWYLRESDASHMLGFYPPPDVLSGHTWTAYVTYVADPVDMSGDSEEPYTTSSDVRIALRPWHQALVHFAASKLESLRRNYAIEDRQRQLFAAYVADYLAQRRRKGPQRITMARDYRGEVHATRPPDPYSWP